MCVRLSYIHLHHALVIVFREGGPRAVGGGFGDFMGILQHIFAPVVGEMKGL